MERKIKKFMSILLILVMLSSVTFIGDAAENTVLTVTHIAQDLLKREFIESLAGDSKEKFDTIKINAVEDFSYNDWNFVKVINNELPSLEHIIVTGDGVTQLEYQAFADDENNTWLKTVSMPNLQTMESFAFQNCTSLIYADFPNVFQVDSFSFDECTNLEYINMPNVKMIDMYAFSNCKSLTNIYFPEVKMIMDNAFAGCSKLKDVYIPNALYIGDSGFEDCDSLENINMTGVEILDFNSFAYCENLTKIIIPNIKNIGDQAFMFSENIDTYVFGETPPTVSPTYSGGTHMSPTYFHFGSNSDFENLIIDPDTTPKIISHNINSWGNSEKLNEKIFAEFSEYKFQNTTISYDKFMSSYNSGDYDFVYDNDDSDDYYEDYYNDDNDDNYNYYSDGHIKNDYIPHYSPFNYDAIALFKYLFKKLIGIY